MNYHIKARKECDLAVVGGGGGGMIAAARAAWLSKKNVIVLEKGDHTGGSAEYASATRIFGSKWQKDRGLPDITQEFILKAMDSVFWRLDSHVVANCFRATGEFFDWICDLADNAGDKFEAGYYVFDGPEGGPKIPVFKGQAFHRGSGRYFMETMLGLCQKLGAEVLTEHRVVDVEVKNGKITAVIADTPNGHVRVGCKACVLASGSWVNHKEVLKKIAPVFIDFLETDHIDPEVSDHHRPILSGDSVALAEKVGAFLDWDSFCLRPIGPMFKDMRLSKEVMYVMAKTPFNIMVNLTGKRWVCEPPQVRMGIFNAGQVMMLQPKGLCYAVFDENTLAAALKRSKEPAGDIFARLPPEGAFLGDPKFPETTAEVYANIENTLKTDTRDAFRADTVEDLAGKIGVEPRALKETVATYNASCKTGVDWEFFKPAKDLVPLNKAPYYAVKGRLGSDGAFGGVRVNPDMQACKDGGGLVEGLYVVGDFATGKHINMSGVRVQVINDSSWAYASGFIAGASAAKYLQSLDRNKIVIQTT